MRNALINNFSKLNDIREAMEDILSFTNGMDEAGFLHDLKTCYAVERALVIMGEATKKLSGDFTAAHSQLPWAEIAKMRDKIAHHYDHVDYRKIWRTIDDIIPAALPILRKLIDVLDAELIKQGK